MRKYLSPQPRMQKFYNASVRRMSMRGVQIILVAVVVVLLTCEGRADATLLVSGRVVTATGEPIPEATVVLLGRGGRLRPPIAVELLGDFRLELTETTESYLRCEVSAPDYLPLRTNVLIVKGIANAGELRLHRKAPVSLGQLQVLVANGGEKFFIDVFATKHGEHPVEVQAIELEGNSRKTTNCLDYAPALMFELSPIVRLQRSGSVGDASVAIVDPRTSGKDVVAALVKLEELPCRQLRLRLRVNSTFQLSDPKPEKLRLVIARTLRVRGDQDTRPWHLENWAQLLFRLHLASGATVETTYLAPIPTHGAAIY